MKSITPYYAVIFTSLRAEGDHGYQEMAKRMEALARTQSGFLGFETARNEVGISVSYWERLEDITRWKQNAEHLEAQRQGGRVQLFSLVCTEHNVTPLIGRGA